MYVVAHQMGGRKIRNVTTDVAYTPPGFCPYTT